MRLILVAAFLLSGFVGVSPAHADQDEQRECWSDIVEFDDGSNFFLLCISGTKATALVFYPNSGTEKPPTICRQIGSAARPTSEQVVVHFDEGPCENSRTISESELTCLVDSENSLACKLPDGSELLLQIEGHYKYVVESDETAT